MHSLDVGGKKTHSELDANSSIFPWQFILDGYAKAILTITRGRIRNTSSIFDISPTTTIRFKNGQGKKEQNMKLSQKANVWHKWLHPSYIALLQHPGLVVAYCSCL